MKQDEIDYTKESVLIVDDDSFVRETLEQLLSTLGFATDSASDGQSALKILESRECTFLLTDMRMPEMDGLALIKRVGESFSEISIVAMTGYSEGYRYVDVINAGASDFIKKPFDLEELEAKVRRIITERNLRRELNRLSITDSVTGLYNQRHFYTRLNEEVTRARRQRHPLSLILLDLDNFKKYNDTYGHLAGDEMLRSVGLIINKCIRENVDSGYRYGGDEFAIILIDAHLNVAEEIGKRIQNAFNKNEDVSISVGWTVFTESMKVKDLVAEADKNLYDAKIKSKPK